MHFHVLVNRVETHEGIVIKYHVQKVQFNLKMVVVDMPLGDMNTESTGYTDECCAILYLNIIKQMNYGLV